MRPYVVRAGDTLGRIARTNGHAPESLWSHPRNAELRALRAHSEVLLPGDVLYLPDAVPAGPAFRKGADNAYAAEVPTVVVRLTLRHEGAALADEPCVLLGAGEPRELRSDAGGVVTLSVPGHAELVDLVLVERGVKIPVAVGHLDPVDSPSGQAQRLRHLGYLDRGAADGLSAAVATFQRAEGLAVTGSLDETTRTALARAHGG